MFFFVESGLVFSVVSFHLLICKSLSCYKEIIQIWDVLKNSRPKWIDGLVVYTSSKCFGWFVFILLMCLMCMLYLCALDCSYICENHALKPQVWNINCQGQQTFRDMSMLIRFPLLVVDQRWSKIHFPFSKCDIEPSMLYSDTEWNFPVSGPRLSGFEQDKVIPELMKFAEADWLKMFAKWHQIDILLKYLIKVLERWVDLGYNGLMSCYIHVGQQRKLESYGSEELTPMAQVHTILV